MAIDPNYPLITCSPISKMVKRQPKPTQTFKIGHHEVSVLQRRPWLSELY